MDWLRGFDKVHIKTKQNKKKALCFQSDLQTVGSEHKADASASFLSRKKKSLPNKIYRTSKTLPH